MRAPPTCRNPAGDGAKRTRTGQGGERSHDNYVSGPALFGKAAQVATLGPRAFYGSSDLMQVEELDLAGNIARIRDRRSPGADADPGMLITCGTDDVIHGKKPSKFNQELHDLLFLPMVNV